jgi:hypothetical protein
LWACKGRSGPFLVASYRGVRHGRWR